MSNSESTHVSALSADALAQEIRRVDGDHTLGASALAEALMPFLTAAQPQLAGEEAVALGKGDFYGNGEGLPTLHDDPLINREIQVQALAARLDTTRRALAAAAAMQVVTPVLQQIKANAAWAMDETNPSRVLPRSFGEFNHPPAASAPDKETIVDREFWGRVVRMEWMEWAKEQPNPKPSWLMPWEKLSEPEREVDRRIGARLISMFYGMQIRPAHSAPGGDEASDAARYRWLREQDWFSSDLCVVRTPKRSLALGAYCPSREMLDEIIDAALPAKGEAT